MHSYRDLEAEIMKQTAKANMIAVSLNDVYKTTIRSVLTYTAEKRKVAAKPR